LSIREIYSPIFQFDFNNFPFFNYGLVWQRWRI